MAGLQDAIDELTYKRIEDGMAYRVVDEAAIAAGSQRYYLLNVASESWETVVTDLGYFSTQDTDITVYGSYNEVSAGSSIDVANLNTGSTRTAVTSVEAGGDYDSLSNMRDVDKIRPGGTGDSSEVIGSVSNVARVVAPGDDILLEVDNVSSSEADFVGKIRFFEKTPGN